MGMAQEWSKNELGEDFFKHVDKDDGVVSKEEWNQHVYSK